MWTQHAEEGSGRARHCKLAKDINEVVYVAHGSCYMFIHKRGKKQTKTIVK